VLYSGALANETRAQPAAAAGFGRAWGIAVALMVASALFAVVSFDPQQSSVELAAVAAPQMAKPISSEPTLVHAAESATASFADNDVSEAVLKAQQQAKAQYQAMMASALKAEAKAHKVGQKATERALAAQAKAEQAKIQQRRMRAQNDEQRQAAANFREQARMTTEIDRSLGSRVMLGQ